MDSKIITEWYEMEYATTLEAGCKEHTNVILYFKNVSMLTGTKCFNQQFIDKYSIIKVPNTGFSLKISYTDSVNDMHVYYQYTSLSPVYVTSTLYTSMLGPYSCYFKASLTETLLSGQWYTYRDTDQYSLIGSLKVTRGPLKFEFFTPIGGQNSDVYDKVRNDFENLLKVGPHHDVILKSSEGIEIKAHKAILSARSPVLRAHFEHDTLENLTNTVKTSWKAYILRDIVSFIYTGNIPEYKIKTDPSNFLEAADYYQIDELKEVCAQSLCKQLTVENAVHTLKLAMLYSSQRLVDTTLKFIANGNVKNIIQTKDWADINDPVILKMFLKVVVDKDKTAVDIFSEAGKELGLVEKM